jgi:hypothetical protein
MGRISKGILGGVSGKVGNVVGGNWKGIDYLRILPASVANPKTPKQVDQRSKFMRVIRFLQPVTGYVRIGFKSYAVKMTAFNAAMSYNFKHAITGSYPDYEIDYTKALISRGNLTGMSNATVASAQPGQVTLSWQDNSGDGNAHGNDRVMLVAFNTIKDKAVMSFEAATRADETATIELPLDWSGDTIECFASLSVFDELISTGGKKSISDSVYAGSVTVA